MADGFDPCECMWNQDAAMQRLISLVSMQMKDFLKLLTDSDLSILHD